MSFWTTVKEGAKNALYSYIGNIQKGVIEIVDINSQLDTSVMGVLPSDMLKVEAPVDAGGVSEEPESNLKPFKVDYGLDNKLKNSVMGENAKKFVDNTLNAENSVLYDPDTWLETTTTNNLQSLNTKRFTVQFNPSEIQLSGYGGGMYSKLDYTTEGDGINFESMNPRITLTVNLIFDEADPLNAFMGDKFKISASNIFKNAVVQSSDLIQTNLSKYLSRNGKETVQDKAEAFTAALRNEGTRIITFKWGDMCYTGTLIRVSVQYTMFDTSGTPVRAIVTLSMVCLDLAGKATALESDPMVQEWLGYYKKAFSNSTFGLGSVATSAQKVTGNILNLNL